MKPLDIGAVLIVVVLWGLNFIAIKIGIDALPPVFVLALRSTIAGLILVWWVPMPKAHLKQIAVLAVVMGGVHFSLLNMGMMGVDVSVAAVMTLLGVPFSAILARVILKDMFGWRRAAGMGVAFAGVAVLVGRPEGDSGVYYALLLVVCSFAWGLGNVLIKQMGQVNVLSMMAYLLLFSAPIQLVVSVIFETGQITALQGAGMEVWAAILYMSIGSSIIGYALWYSLIKKYDISQVAPFGLLAPVVAAIAAVLIFGEDFGVQKIIGTVMTLAGVLVIQLRWRRPASPQV